MALSLGRIFLVYLPFAWIGVLTIGYQGVLAATIAANLLAVGGAMYAVKSVGLLPFDRLPLRFGARTVSNT